MPLCMVILRTMFIGQKSLKDKANCHLPTPQGMVGLSRALRVFEDEKLNLVHIESRKVKGCQDKLELYLEIDSAEKEDWNKIQHVIETLRGVDLCPRYSQLYN